MTAETNTDRQAPTRATSGTAPADVPPSEHTKFGAATGDSVAMRTVFAVLSQVAPTDTPVLLEGEIGSGKSLLARALHHASLRARQPFVTLDCSAGSRALLEGELFGHERAASAGAASSRRSAFENADGGTLLLDEVGDLPLYTQPRLLRVLRSKELRRGSGTKPIRVDVRIVASTRRDLKREVDCGRFREDLYFWLAEVPIAILPLRARREDVRGLVQLFLQQGSDSAAGSGPLSIADEAISTLTAHDWPGNVRELRAVVERAVRLARAAGDRQVRLASLPAAAERSGETYAFQPGRSYRDTRSRYEAEFERRYVKWLLGRHAGNISAAAREAQMDRKYLYDLAKKHRMRGKDGDDG